MVVKLPTDLSSIVAKPRDTKLRLRSNASYLLTGGMGGLGVPISRWLVEHGAKSLVYLSRSAGQRPGHQELIRELETSGCSVTTVSGHAESLEDVQQAISLAPQPIAGVIHLAMVLRDAPIAKMDHADWEAANAPKVGGAWNLHHSLRGHQLDFFVLASSIVATIEQPGQGNYSAANTFLEAFTQYRRSLSLPASVINICPIDGVGFVGENAFARKNMKAQGLYFLGETELFDFLELAIRLSPASTTTTSHLPWAATSDAKDDQDASLSQQHPWTSTGQMVMGLRSEGDLNDSSTQTSWRRDRRMGFYHNYNNARPGQKDSSSRLSKLIQDATNDARLLDEASGMSFIAQEIGKKVFALMLKDEDDLNTSLTLHQAGLDSLMAIELRRWWKLTFGLEISVLELMASGTLDMLAAVAVKGLKESLASIA